MISWDRSKIVKDFSTLSRLSRYAENICIRNRSEIWASLVAIKQVIKVCSLQSSYS